MEALCAGALTPQCKERDLSTKDVEWILSKEGNETTYLKFDPAPGGPWREHPRDWLSRGTFWYKTGHVVTLAEMFRFGCRECTCFDIYRTFVHLQFYAFKKAHSQSQSESGVQRRQAKILHYEETSHYGLPKTPQRW